MKKLLSIALLCIVLFSACKKDSTADTTVGAAHTIKVVVSGSAAYTVAVSYIAKGTTTNVSLQTKDVPSEAYTFSADLHTGDVYILDLRSTTTSTVTYTIYDNNKIITTKTGDVSPSAIVKAQYIIQD